MQKNLSFFRFRKPLAASKSERKVTMRTKGNLLFDNVSCPIFALRTGGRDVPSTIKNDVRMKRIETTAAGANFSAASFGKLDELGGYLLELGPDVKIPGKVFGGGAVGATGGEFSFQLFQPGTETGFLHTHRTHEELYFFLRGEGEFQVDGERFPVAEGSVVRVAPAGRRSVRNNGDTPLAMLCVQYRGGTFTAEDAADGVILPDRVAW